MSHCEPEGKKRVHHDPILALLDSHAYPWLNRRPPACDDQGAIARLKKIEVTHQRTRDNCGGIPAKFPTEPKINSCHQAAVAVGSSDFDKRLGREFHIMHTIRKVRSTIGRHPRSECQRTFRKLRTRSLGQVYQCQPSSRVSSWCI